MFGNSTNPRGSASGFLSVFGKRNRPIEGESAPVVAAPVATPDLMGSIQIISRLASRLGQDAAEVRGEIDDATQVSQRGARAVQELAIQVREVQTAQGSIASVTDGSRDAVARARVAVEDVGKEVGAVVDSLRQVSDAAVDITKIALQTRLVAFNASVEAKRAGEAGRGFGVVADAVKDLSARVESSSKAIRSTIEELDARITRLVSEIATQGQSDGQGAFHKALADVETGVVRIAEAAGQSRSICAELENRMDAIEQEISQVVATLGSANQRSEAFLKAGEQLIEVVADSGVETDDTPFIRAAQQAAEDISRLLEEGLNSGALQASQLWDESYRPIKDSDPQQFLTTINAFTDAEFPQIQEHMLSLSDRVVFCIASDRNGYIPTHNQRYCQPQRRGDATWNTANSRWRRIFNDRTGLTSARNTRPFLLQTYRRDMGGGNFVLLKEAAAPIVVQGRHWGGVRLAFKF